MYGRRPLFQTTLHVAIGRGASHIILVTGSHNIVNFNSDTKRYITTTLRTDLPRTKLVSVGMFNVNTRYGRVYDYEHRRTIPFIVHRQAEARTMGNVGTSLNRYARGTLDKDVMIKFIAETDVDSRAKRYILLDAWFPER
jgi:hypothetical protein